ncbi:MAG: ABC transporter permease subunit, partial [Hyphomicrobium sp.]
ILTFTFSLAPGSPSRGACGYSPADILGGVPPLTACAPPVLTAGAIGLAVGLWLVSVIVYDLALMGLLVASKGGVGADIFPSLLLLNPADTYRLFNLTAFENIRKISGMAGLSASAQFSPAVLLAALIAWIAVPLAAALAVFNRREA